MIDLLLYIYNSKATMGLITYVLEWFYYISIMLDNLLSPFIKKSY